MNVLNIEHISKIYGDKVIFDDASAGIHEGEKIGIVGINGTGKTSLLRMIAGEETPDGGQLVQKNGLTYAWLPQTPLFPKGATVASYAGNGTVEWKVLSNLTKLGITDYSAKIEELSGGQKRKVALAKVLAQDFDLLLLDEPTNHLDDSMIQWLEDYLRNYKGTVLMVTHDRYFLDRVCSKIFEISHGKIYSYDGDYSRFLELKAQREEMELASERKRQSILRIELEWAKRGCRARSTKQRARLERLEALKAGRVPLADDNVAMSSAQTRMGKKTIELHHVSKSFGNQKIVEDFSYTVPRKQRLGFIGPNGCGKTTLLKIIAGLMEPDSGFVDIGETIKIGYLAQEAPAIDPRQRVIDFIKEIGEFVLTEEGRISASEMLERFLFTPQMQYTPVEKLSGGELRRLYLLSVLMGGVNVLILDEPSNDLDIPTLTILEDYLSAFSGIVITVSHDRYFLDTVVDRIFVFDGAGHLRQYEGGYTDYLNARMKEEDYAEQLPEKEDKKAGEKETKSWKQDRPQKLKFTYKEQKEFETIDNDIEAAEGLVAKLDQEMMVNATDAGKLAGLLKQKEEAQAALDHLMERWVYLNDLAEKIEAQKG